MKFIKLIKASDVDNAPEYFFTFNREGDKLNLTTGNSQYEVTILSTDTKDDIFWALQDFANVEFTADLDDSENIEETEIVDYKYDDNTNKGSFKIIVYFY